MFYFYLTATLLTSAGSAYYFRKPIFSAYNTVSLTFSWSSSAMLTSLFNFRRSLVLPFWKNLMHDMHTSKSPELFENKLKWLLKLDPSLVNHKETIKLINFSDKEETFENVTMLEIVLANADKGHLKYNLIYLLIDASANISHLIATDYLYFKGAYVGNKRKLNYLGDMSQNLMHYLLEYINYIKKYEPDKYECDVLSHKTILDKICNLYGPNHRMHGGVPLLAYAPSWEIYQYLIEKGANPKLKNPANGKDALDYLMQADKYDHLNLFIKHQYIPDITLGKIAQSYSIADLIYVVITPELSSQLTDIEKARTLCMIEDKIGAHLHSKSKFNSETKMNLEWIEPMIVDLCIKSEECLRLLSCGKVLMNLSMVTKTSESYKAIIRHWEKKDPIVIKNINDADNQMFTKNPWVLKRWQCLPEGYATRFDPDDLDQRWPKSFRETLAAKMLEVEPTCSQRDVKVAFNKAALIYHPDKNTGPWKRFANEEFDCIRKAREILLKR